MEDLSLCAGGPAETTHLFQELYSSIAGIPYTTPSVRVRLPGGAPLVINPKAESAVTRSPMNWRHWQSCNMAKPPPVVKLPPKNCRRGWADDAVKRAPTFLTKLRRGTEFIRGFVARQPLYHPTDTDAFGCKVKIGMVEQGWKPLHIRSGFFPRKDEGARASQSVVEDLVQPRVFGKSGQTVHWSQLEGSAQRLLEQQVRVIGNSQSGPGIRKLSEASASARLRRRARWVLSMNPDKDNEWLGKLLKGRWTPDLSREFAPSHLASFVAAWGDRVKFLGGGTLKTLQPSGEEDKEDTVLEHTYVLAEINGSVVPLYPALLARLSSYAAFRVRGASLVQALKVRATEWCKKSCFTEEQTADTLAASVALAHYPSRVEKSATKLLEEESSVVGPPSAHWWTSVV